MKKLNKFQLALLGFIVGLKIHAYGESSTCLMVYKEGGAPAVFRSPKCPRWKLSSFAKRRPWASRCETAMHQGQRNYQEDRTFCILDLPIPFPGPTGIREVKVGIMAVFDGHNGAEASEMASKLLLEYFTLHTYFLLDMTFFPSANKHLAKLPDIRDHDLIFQAPNWDDALDGHVLDRIRFTLTSSTVSSGSFYLEILKESLLRAIHDIDSTFTKEAYRYNLDSGSTATIILIADDQFLVANVGDSKALLCSEEFQSLSEAKATFLRLYKRRRDNHAIPPIKYNDLVKLGDSNGVVHFSVKELTRDHHPDRDEEKFRVESAGGYVLEWGGVSRVNGQLAVSRAIGDISFKSYGVISAPEVTDWQPLSSNDSYLVAASDGIFEQLSPQDVCDLLWESQSGAIVRSELPTPCSYSLADCIVDIALEKGTVDNMAAVIVPLRSTGSSPMLLEESPDQVGNIDRLAFGVQTFINEESVAAKHAHPVAAKFDRLLIEGKHDMAGCFYLFENLNEDVAYVFSVKKVDQQDMFDQPQSVSEALNKHCDGPLNLYNDQSMCMHFGLTVNGDSGKCINPEGFAGFLGFLESIPIPNIGSEDGSAEHAMPDSRYVLKKRFDRGAFGEVWLAFYWNCTKANNSSNGDLENGKFSFYAIDRDTYNGSNSETSSSAPGDGIFILKRIMVERGTNVYLSGLREKYFGEVFLNASSGLGGLLSSGMPNTVLKKSQSDLYDYLQTNESAAHEIGGTPNLGSTSKSGKRLHRVAEEEGLNHIARYVESFESRSNEMWLVFHHEGLSLSKLLYTAEEFENNANDDQNKHAKHVQMLRPSKWWHWLKTTETGQEEMRNLIWQLLMALKSCHDRNITHRDIKPENMVICFEDQDTGRCLKGVPSGDKKFAAQMRIIDFGSAMDVFTVKHLYGLFGPSRAEQTYEYTPPEALLNASWYQGPLQRTMKYDMWSTGVVFLELILGSPDVFQMSTLARALLDQHLEGWNEGLKELAHKLRSLMELCILIPGSSSKNHRSLHMKGRDAGSPASWKCSEEYFSQQIKNRDPLKIGFPNVWALRLVRRLLVWDPDDRLSVDEALQHPYFQPQG